MAVDRDLLLACREQYSHAVLAFVDRDGYPVSVATGYAVDADRGVVALDLPGGDVGPPEGVEANVIFSHIRPLPEMGYDERRYVQFWGPVRRADGRLELAPERAHTWDESKLPFFQYAEVSVPQGHRYLRELGVRVGRPIRPRLGFGWLFLRATRLPFLTATLVPVLAGIAVAALDGRWSLLRGVLTFLGGAFIHLALNVANDVFDHLSGADPANQTPTQFSGGSRVIHYGLLSLRAMALLSAGFYVAGIGIGLYLAAISGFWPLFWLGAVGVFISVAYTAPPFRLVHRGVGEIVVALGFGPIMTLGAYYVQAGRFDIEAGYLSIPVAILIALVLYVNEIPDRRGDAAVGKRTLPVRLSKDAVIGLYVGAVAATYLAIAVGAAAGIIARPAAVALATIPLAVKVTRGLRDRYDDPYALMPTMATNIQLHLFTGLLLFAGYLAAIAADRLMTSVPFFLR
ncbi:MAG TPA: prenyltransferase [Actinomycetota bacterium]|nr:prenyltransferase [Actinomycetota bacterium]